VIALDKRVEKGMYRVDSYMIQYVTLLILRWCILPAQSRAAYYRRPYVRGDL
jgi:hypothetical protein